MKKMLLLISIVLCLNAGIFTQKLSECFIKNTSSNDRILLAKWMFVVLSQYPELKSLSNVTPKVVDSYNKKVAFLFKRLLTKDCKKEASLVLKYEPGGMSESFNILGKIAAGEIMLNKNVLNAVKGYTKYIDMEKIVKELTK
ncbi:conserved hypothetical protein [Nautilia profundicola AmH]|uniref:Uncharacterized protein n=1 Tax=Nautilia profundicola (strain ATCC BAA-1463 / DSM 18972 / AmH) TaxID=598659 RepID=B9L656_NAUPA|nr:hypothetical protein [Nautilia profundicola]ACM92983.1 conserved hypothetical protein [Nautilia profundicola AmH]